jgi:hypothetical protein
MIMFEIGNRGHAWEACRITIAQVPGFAFERPVAESESDARGGSF